MLCIFRCFSLALLLLCLAAGVRADDILVADAYARCAFLAKSGLANVRIDVAEPVTQRKDLPPFCRVTGQIAPSIGFEMRLPMQGWNGRFLLAGCGAYCGELVPDREGYANSINFALRRGYAATTTDSGHQAPRTDTSWAYNNPQAETLYAHAWVPLAADASRAILHNFYRQKESWSYFSGCSNGGRTALKVAQMYPDLFDGIASGAPGINATYAAGVLGVFLDRTLVDKSGNLILREEKVPMLSQAVLYQCDSLDGLTDGLVSDPGACDFQPESLLCRDEGDTSTCLTAAEVEEVNRLYAGAQDSQGQQVYFGLPKGSEAYWTRWLLGETASGVPHVTDLGSNFLRYLGFEQDPGPGYHSSEFDLDGDIPKLESAARRFNATDPNLGKLQQSGGKLLMYHGLADPLTVPEESITYYNSVVNHAGSADQVSDFYRLFLIPGADHCWGVTGRAPDLFDPLQVLEGWVERDEAPERIVARQHVAVAGPEPAGPIMRTRPLCPYPAVARYRGEGSYFDADNFICQPASDGQGVGAE